MRPATQGGWCRRIPLKPSLARVLSKTLTQAWKIKKKKKLGEVVQCGSLGFLPDYHQKAKITKQKPQRMPLAGKSFLALEKVKLKMSRKERCQVSMSGEPTT